MTSNSLWTKRDADKYRLQIPPLGWMLPKIIPRAQPAQTTSQLRLWDRIIAGSFTWDKNWNSSNKSTKSTRTNKCNTKERRNKWPVRGTNQPRITVAIKIIIGMSRVNKVTTTKDSIWRSVRSGSPRRCWQEVDKPLPAKDMSTRLSRAKYSRNKPQLKRLINSKVSRTIYSKLRVKSKTHSSNPITTIVTIDILLLVGS